MKKFRSSILGLVITLLVLTLITFLYFALVNKEHMPIYFWVIPVFFLVISGVLGAIEKNYTTQKKQLSVGTIIGIRVFFISIIGVFALIIMLIDREHILPSTIVMVLFAFKFLYFETKILLKLNQIGEEK